jgi:hypothetical protein
MIGVWIQVDFPSWRHERTFLLCDDFVGPGIETVQLAAAHHGVWEHANPILGRAISGEYVRAEPKAVVSAIKNSLA